MKQVILAGAAIIVAITALLTGLSPINVAETASPEQILVKQADKQINPTGIAKLEQAEPVSVEQSSVVPLDATISITMDVPLADNPTQARLRHGLGTLVHHEGEILVITHDHWGEMLNTMAFGRLWSTDGELLLELDGAAYREMIIYRDGGTMVLRVPDGVINASYPSTKNPIALDDRAAVQVGDKVLVVVRRPDTSHQVEIQEAVVESVEDQYGLPSLTMRRLNGKAIEPGDSGGGVWIDGRLVGNLWYRVKHRVVSNDDQGVAVESLRLTDLAVAACPPLETG